MTFHCPKPLWFLLHAILIVTFHLQITLTGILNFFPVWNACFLRAAAGGIQKHTLLDIALSSEESGGKDTIPPRKLVWWRDDRGIQVWFETVGQVIASVWLEGTLGRLEALFSRWEWKEKNLSSMVGGRACICHSPWQKQPTGFTYVTTCIWFSEGKKALDYTEWVRGIVLSWGFRTVGFRSSL